MKGKEQEVEEAISKVPQIHRKIARKAKSIDQEIAILEKEIKALLTSKKNPEITKQILSRFCLLSELCGVKGFSEMIRVRKLFQKTYPEYFQSFLKQIDQKDWELKWSGCLDCIHFNFACSLSLTPKEVMKEGRWEMDCPSFEKHHR